jgi:hypothetical protein
VQGLVAAESARMSLEEEVAQSVSKAIGVADAGEAAEEEGKTSGPDLVRLAPPAPETAANGDVAPPRTGADSLPPAPAAPPAPAHRPGAHEGPPRRPGAPAEDLGQQPGTTAPPVSPVPGNSVPGNSTRLGPPEPQGGPRSTLPIPSGSPLPGPATPDNGRPGLIDPDEPTEGIRLMR